MKPILSLTREQCLELHDSLRKEWLETDGCGGFASSTVLLCPTRRYHGLLVAPAPGLDRRHSFLSRFEETVHGEGHEFPISMARYPTLWYPHGHRSIAGFALRPYPTFEYHIGPVSITRELLMVRGAPVVLCRYLARFPHAELQLRLRPLLTCREADALTHENLALDPRVRRFPLGVSVRPYAALPAVSFTVGGAPPSFEADPVWSRQVEYQRDLVRGYDGHEDQFSPGWFDLPLHAGRELVVAATIAEPVDDPLALWREEARRRETAALSVAPGFRGRLELAAEDFLYRDANRRLAVVAGFPWFGEWGRDTFLSLPGLLLARGRVEECGEALEGSLRYLRDGAMPNVIGPTPESSSYDSLDSALWFAWATAEYAAQGGSSNRLERSLRPAIEEIAASLLGGRAPGLSVDPDGLVVNEPPSQAATWMDARSQGDLLTPRWGCPVEVNALWYALLCFLERRHREAGRDSEAAAWDVRRRRAALAFLERLWLESGYLADRWQDGVADPAVRPNMVVAAALAESPLSQEQRVAVVERVERELLTPVGLRTLSPEDPAYEGRYSGGPERRDHAYHQGTAWPWLLGFYVEACLRARGRRADEVARLRSLLDGFSDQLQVHGLLHVSEVHDGDPPYRPGGAPAQAWSTAELLRAYHLLEGGPT
ncbi:MAG TPA: amylo-alpha-1,6-glucosidase [Thermoanaerobaculia bacterium]|nr:amylo-alpha-1,6-glucosidase [Thermoanaerobaculia bacterium]